MVEPRDQSFEAYARRRYALSGVGLRVHFPYCSPIEDLNVNRPGEGGGLVSFAHYDYLGLASDQRIAQAINQAVEEFGFGVGASRLVGGESSEHRKLERELSEFLGVDDTLALVSGYCANFSLVGHVLTKDDLIIYDEAAHNSIIAGTQASRASIVSFRHNDLDHLEALLVQRRNSASRVLVVVEGLYSMDGDIPDLPSLLELCRSHGAWLMVDEAHSIGVLGATGRGICEHYGIEPSEVDLIVGTLSKAFVGCGGFISAKQIIIDWLRFTLPGFVYSVGISPPAVATARKALAILRDEPVRLRRLRENSSHFLRAARAHGLDVGKAIGAAVIPLRFPDNPTAIEAAHTALAAGYFAPPIIHIAVPKEAPRLRCFVTAAHERHHIDGLLESLSPLVMRSTAARAPFYSETVADAPCVSK